MPLRSRAEQRARTRRSYNAGMDSRLASRALQWYGEHGRQLPWRQTRDPYAIWVSEIMLQQTRVEVVIPYFERWMQTFPTTSSLAVASTDEVLAVWEGLGYYRRALNLHEAARRLSDDSGGQIPQDRNELLQLPGIGRYTAAAIAAFAFGADEIALDGNLRRVLARLCDLTVDPSTPEGEARLMEFAFHKMPRGRAADFNQALMDLGAMVCVPRRPRCDLCPLDKECLARRRGVECERPIRSAKRRIPLRVVAAAVVRRHGRVLIGRRPKGKLLGGLWEFPGGKVEGDESLNACIRREMREEVGVSVAAGSEIGVFHHAYTHFRVTVHALECRLVRGEPKALEHTDLRWVPVRELGKFPMGKVDRAIAAAVADGARRTPRQGTSRPVEKPRRRG